MSMTAEEERKAEDKLTGVKPRSKGYWKDKFIVEFALMSRKLRKGQTEAAHDKYYPIIERNLLKYDAAIALLERYPQLAAEYGEDGKGIEDILELIERKAAEQETDEMFKESAAAVRKLEPGAIHNQMIRKAQSGGLVKTLANSGLLSHLYLKPSDLRWETHHSCINI